MHNNSPEIADDLLMGAEKIAIFLGIPRRQIYYLSSTTDLPCFKIGSALCARKSRIVSWIEAQEASSNEAA